MSYFLANGLFNFVEIYTNYSDSRQISYSRKGFDNYLCDNNHERKAEILLAFTGDLKVLIELFIFKYQWRNNV